MNDEDELPLCPIATVLEFVNTKWKFFIIRDLLAGTKRFGELKRSTGASQKSLTSNLRDLENSGIVDRQVFPEVPPRVEYTLTDIGYSLGSIVEPMAQWGSAYKEYCRLKNKRKK